MINSEKTLNKVLIQAKFLLKGQLIFFFIDQQLESLHLSLCVSDVAADKDFSQQILSSTVLRSDQPHMGINSVSSHCK